MLFRITANAVHHTTDDHGVSTDNSKQIPTFILDGKTLGIKTEKAAEEIARHIIAPFDLQYEGITVHAHAVRLT